MISQSVGDVNMTQAEFKKGAQETAATPVSSTQFLSGDEWGQELIFKKPQKEKM